MLVRWQERDGKSEKSQAKISKNVYSRSKKFYGQQNGNRTRQCGEQGRDRKYHQNMVAMEDGVAQLKI